VLLFDLSGQSHGTTERITGVDRSLTAALPATPPALVIPPGAR
jgi:hypothetical protein